MCTVSFLPLSAKGDFVLTSNRDEQPRRAAVQIYEQDGLLFPKEPQAGGTWICASDEQKMVCLLNGAFEAHQPAPPYRKSRGLVVLDYFRHSGAESFAHLYNFHHIEPFTMIIWEKGSLYELRWDEQKAHFKHLDSQKPHIWSSCPLYAPSVRALREQWFADFLQNQPHNPDSILSFHKNAGNGDPENSLVMRRADGRQTISQTQIIYHSEQQSFELHYHDFINQTKQNASISLQGQA